MRELSVPTREPVQFLDLTSQVQAAVNEDGLRDGFCLVFVPHTTAGITINEDADPDVVSDLLMQLDQLVPLRAGYAHGEGNSAAHIKATLVGSSVTVPVVDGRLRLGTWQGIYFCEFDGPRRRQAWVQAVSV